MKQMKKIWFLVILASMLLVASCTSKKQKENTLNLSGAFALYPMAIKWSEVYQKEHPEIRFNISAGGAGKGMADALAGTVDLGMFSREITDDEKDKGVWWVGLCIDAVLPTISSNNPYLRIIQQRGISQARFMSIFIDGSMNDWGEVLNIDEPGAIQVYTRSDACGAAGTWAQYLGGLQEDLKGVGIHGDPALAEAVSNDPTGIAFNNTIFVYDIKTGKKRNGIDVIPIDINGNGSIDSEEDFYGSFETILDAVANGIYPSPPARELYFVAKEKPQKQATIDFLNWVLTDGQAFIKEAGYVPIDQEQINKYLNKLN